MRKDLTSMEGRGSEMSLHPLDRVGKFTKEELDKFLIFCLIDRGMPYARVCHVFDYLDARGLTTRKGLQDKSITYIEQILREAGCRFPRQIAGYLYSFKLSDIDLETTTREELTQLPGIGYKLASMFLRNTRGENYAVIDRHIKAWLREQGITSNSYKELEREFLRLCQELKKSPYELDMQIWQERRRKNLNTKKV